MRFLILLALFANTLFASEPTLIGGIEAKPGDFPEVIYISAGSSRCSATLVGPRAILTAAHCVANGGVIKPVSFVVDQVVYTASCKHEPGYTGYDFDMAICKTSEAVVSKYASISDKGPSIGEAVTLSGYGCITPRKPDGSGGSGGNDGKLRYGTAPVTDLPSDSYHWFNTQGSSALCFGDSGGPAFLQVGEPAKMHHYVIGVNSRGDISKLSMLTAVYMPRFRDFLAGYAKDQKIEICGINKDCVSKGEPDDPQPECQPALDQVIYYKGKVDKWQKIYDQCQQTKQPIFNGGDETIPYITE